MSSPNLGNKDNGDEDEEAIVKCGTSKGDITLKFVRRWSPNGYDRAVELFERHYYDNTHFFRVVPNFLVQFGITYSKDKELKQFGRKTIPDDPQFDPPIKFEPGIISYAGSGVDSRNSQLFISYGSAKSLGKEVWETPVGKVIDGLDHARQFYSYGDMPPWGKGPVQGKIHNGPEYIEEEFPLTDHFEICSVKRSGSRQESGADVVSRENDSSGGASNVANRIAALENQILDMENKLARAVRKAVSTANSDIEPTATATSAIASSSSVLMSLCFIGATFVALVIIVLIRKGGTRTKSRKAN